MPILQQTNRIANTTETEQTVYIQWLNKISILRIQIIIICKQQYHSAQCHSISLQPEKGINNRVIESARIRKLKQALRNRVSISISVNCVCFEISV